MRHTERESLMHELSKTETGWIQDKDEEAGHSLNFTSLHYHKNYPDCPAHPGGSLLTFKDREGNTNEENLRCIDCGRIYSKSLLSKLGYV